MAYNTLADGRNSFEKEVLVDNSRASQDLKYFSENEARLVMFNLALIFFGKKSALEGMR